MGKEVLQGIRNVTLTNNGTPRTADDWWEAGSLYYLCWKAESLLHLSRSDLDKTLCTQVGTKNFCTCMYCVTKIQGNSNESKAKPTRERKEEGNREERRKMQRVSNLCPLLSVVTPQRDFGVLGVNLHPFPMDRRWPYKAAPGQATLCPSQSQSSAHCSYQTHHSKICSHSFGFSLFATL